MASPQTRPAVRFGGIIGVGDCFASIAALSETIPNRMSGQTVEANPEVEFEHAALC